MLRKKQLCLSLVFMLAPPLSLACSGIPSASFAYQPMGQGTQYVVEDYNDYGIDFPAIPLPQVKFSQLRHVPDAIPREYDEYDPPGEINHDAVMRAAFSELIKNGGWRFDWLTDGRHVLWAGKIVQNPAGTPKVDVASFRAYGRFAADKDNLYFDGVRTDDNHGEKRVDIASLQQVGGNLQFNDSGEVLKDYRNLYFQGRWLGEAQGYAILGIKSRDPRGPLSPKTSCDLSNNPGPWDTILRTATQVFVNGVAIDGDADSFHIVRWIPGSLLIYRDKAGEKRYSFGKDCLNTFDVQQDKVTWLMRDASRRGDDCRVATIPDVDPQYFRPLNETAAQYKDLLYQVKFISAQDKALTVTRLPDPKLELKRGFNIAGNQIYVIDADNVQTIEATGPLTWFKRPDGVRSPDFAHDGRYIYYLGEWLIHDGLRRHETRELDAAHLSESGDLITVEGTYSSSNNEFFPAKAQKPEPWR